ncbi:MAG: transposase [Magnetococcales bacterium]|nr:transposase [Magnetococcales bacterium]
MDNTSFHNKGAIREVLEQHGHAFLPLPPYSPDFNPVALSSATLKKRRLPTQPPTLLGQLFMCNA